MSTARQWLRWLWENETGFFGIGQGPSQNEQSQYGALANIGNFGTSEGESDVLASDKFWQSILSGDPTQISKVLGPEISGINKQTQQQKKTANEFGNRGGGTNATLATADTTARSSVDSLISELTGKSASALGASGSSLLASGLSAHEAAFSAADTIQQQHAAQMNDLFKSIASVAAAPFTGGASLTGLTGSSSGTSFSKPNWWDNFGGSSTTGSTLNNPYFDESEGTD